MSEYSTLYIIGNGFDLAHGLKSSFEDFKNRLEQTNNFTDIEEYINCSKVNLWSDFEKNIINTTPQMIKDMVESLMDPRFVGNGYDIGDNDYIIVNEIQIGIDYSYYSLRESFQKWVMHLNDSLTSYHAKCQDLKRDALFLSFNYTFTLEHIYGIDTNNIIHIHGLADDYHLTIGGDRELLYDIFDDNELSEIRNKIHASNLKHWYDLVIDQLRNAYEKFSKDVHLIINEHEFFFESLSAIQDIYLLGHSLNDIDQPYFQKIASMTNKNNPTWHVVYYIAENPKENAQEEEKARICSFLQDINVSSSNIDLIESTNYYKETI